MSVNRAFLALGAGEASARLLGFAATIVMARALGPSGYGLVGLAMAVTLYLNRISDLGFDLGLGVREVAADAGFLAAALPTVIAARLLVAGVLILLVFALGTLLLPAPDQTVIAVQALTLLAVGTGARWALVGLDRPRAAAVAMIAGQALMALLVLALVRGPGDVAVVPAAQVAGDLLAAVLFVMALPAALRRLPVRLELARLRPLLPRASWLVVSALLGIVIYNADFLFLRGFHGNSAVGWYAAGYTLVTFFLNLGQAYNLSLLPALTRLRDDRGAALQLYQKSMAEVFALTLPLALGGSLLAVPLIRLCYGPGYAETAVPFAILIWTLPLCFLRDVPVMGLLAGGEEGQVFRLTLLAAILNFVLNVGLIPRFGMLGAAGATLLTEAARALLAIRAAGRLQLSPPRITRFTRTLVAAGAMALVVLLGRGQPVWALIPAGAAGYGVTLWLVGGLRLRGEAGPGLTV